LVISDTDNFSPGSYLFDPSLLCVIQGMRELGSSLLATKTASERGREFRNCFEKCYFTDKIAKTRPRSGVPLNT